MWNVVLPYTRVGVVGGVMLGLGRALGETMAVTFVIGNSHDISMQLFMPGNTISSTLANEFTEAVGPLYTSSLIALGLILFLVTFVVLAIAKILLLRVAAREGAQTLMARQQPLSVPARCLNVFNLFMSMVTTVFGLFWLAWLLWTLMSMACSAMNFELFTHDTPPPGAAGGMANAMIGSLLLTAVGVLVGTPVGLLAGTWLAEYGRRTASPP